MNLNGENMNLDMNTMPHGQPTSDPQDLDLQLQLAADEISASAEQFSNLDFISDEAKIFHVQSYIAYFHPSLPILHLASLNPHSTPPILLKAVLAIGCLYSASRAQSADLLDTKASRNLSQELWRGGCFDLETFVEKNRPRLWPPWVLQSWALLIAYGIFTGDEKCIGKSRDMCRSVIDALRAFELLHQKSVFPPDSAWDADLSLSASSDEVHRRWQLFIDQESVKISLYTFYYFDYHLFASFNMRPMISSLEFEWELPRESSLWEAENATDWWHAMLQMQLELSRGGTLDDKAQLRSVMIATQSLLSNTPSSRLLKALSSSAFGTLCIVANLETLVRDFTRSYYQLPPNLADPSPFHILTQAQNAKISAALVLILSVAADNACISCDSKCRSLWHAVHLGCLSTKISLCKPDDLLVGGIVETSPAAGLATSVHLNLGNYVSARRSGSSSRRKPIGEHGFIAILDEMLKAMQEMGMSDSLSPWEGPWTTVQGFKILIILWQALRFSIAELQGQVCPTPGGDKYAKIYDPARVVVHAIITALNIYDPQGHYVSHESLSTMEGLESVDQLETQFIHWIRKLCDRRDVWDIGTSMGKVLDEICAETEFGQ
ncbi:hypothetical protein BDZ45DRAFT_449718 [Acephala macrosclerotiorum]|nr:hypothetical protein BDZ45DRAFT_449718 [Acephala macrosclerotiorum]